MYKFQSPKSGQWCINKNFRRVTKCRDCFNPLNRVSGVSMECFPQYMAETSCFNPLNRVSGVSIMCKEASDLMICFNPLNRVSGVSIEDIIVAYANGRVVFQSPKSGQWCINFLN